MNWPVVIVLLFGLLPLVLFAAYMAENFLNQRPGRVLYVGSNLREQGKILNEIIQEYIINQGEKTEDYYLVEPGSGLALVSGYLASQFKWKTMYAIELAPIIRFLGLLRLKLRPSTRSVKVVAANLFEFNYPQPAVLYSYLTSELLDDLYARGALEGKLIISLTFPIKNLTPTTCIQLKSWQRQLLVYDLRVPLEQGATHKS